MQGDLGSAGDGGEIEIRLVNYDGKIMVNILVDVMINEWFMIISL